MKIRTQLASLTVLTCVLVSPALAQNTPADPKNVDQSIDALLGDHTKVRQLITDLQQAVAKHDAAAVATLVHYPIRVKLHGKPTYLNNAHAFVKNYDRIMTPDIAAVIQNQKYEDLFVNYQGAMFGNGEIWITGFCMDDACKPPDIKIGTIQSSINPSTK